MKAENGDDDGAGKDRSVLPWLAAVGALIVALALWLTSPWWVSKWAGGQEAGVFGDSFGAFNSLATTLAMVFAGFAFFLQRRELVATTSAIKEQGEHLRQQALRLNEANRLVALGHRKVSLEARLAEISSRIDVLGMGNVSIHDEVNTTMRHGIALPVGFADALRLEIVEDDKDNSGRDEYIRIVVGELDPIADGLSRVKYDISKLANEVDVSGRAVGKSQTAATTKRNSA